MAGFTDNLKGVKEGWNALDGGKKAIIAIIIFGLIISLFVYYFVFGRDTYVPIFSNLNIQDSGKIVNLLDEKGITKYKIEEGGSKILVPEDDVDKLRLQLAMDGGLPSSGTGFEIFDDAGFAVTNEDRKIMYQRALEGELQRSIMTLNEVNYARVHLSLAEDSIFSKEVKPASASVVLELNRFQELSPGKIKGIISLVAGAVKDLPEENVRILDTDANLLSDGILAKDTGFNSTESAKQGMEMKNSFEKQLEDDLKSMLEQTLGYGNVLVKVSANLDFDAKETTTITYDKEGAITSEQTRIVRNEVDGETYSSPIDNNTQNTFDEEDVNDESINSYEAIRNYEVGETTTRTMNLPGKVTNLSTSVIYNGNLSEEMKASIENIVTAAVGYKAERGDMISIEGIKFNTEYQDKIREDIDNYYSDLEENVDEGLDKWIIYAMIAGGSLIILLLIVLIIRSFTKKSSKVNENPFEFPVSGDEYVVGSNNQRLGQNFNGLAISDDEEDINNFNNNSRGNGLEESFGESDKNGDLKVKTSGDDSGEEVENTGLFSNVKKADTKRLIEIIRDEHPQTIALILCHLDSDKASDILSGLPGELKGEVSQRIVNMKSSTPFVIKQVEKILEEKLSTTLGNEIKSIGGVHALIDILKGVDRMTEKNVMEDIERTKPDIAQEIRKNMFVFEDIVHLDGTAIQRVIRDMDKADLSLALKGASDAILNHIYKNMSKRATENLKEDIEFIGPVKLSEVEEAQQKLVNVVRKLHKNGEIDIIRGGEDEVVL